jgi:hypothetical protein
MLILGVTATIVIVNPSEPVDTQWPALVQAVPPALVRAVAPAEREHHHAAQVGTAA